MTEFERRSTAADLWQRMRDMLQVEELILAGMGGVREPENRGHVIAQVARVEALRRSKSVLQDQAFPIAQETAS